MAVSADAVSALRAYLAGDQDEYRRTYDQLDARTQNSTYTALITAAFFEAAYRRFAKAGTTADVVDFVARVRSTSDTVAQRLDPLAAERIILSVYTDESVGDLDDKTVVGAQILLLAGLVADENFNGTELDAFIAQAKAIADEWTR